MAIVYKTYTLPDSYVYTVNTGWNAGANSIGLLDDNASYQFTVPGTPAGVVTGISRPEKNVGYGYTEIEYAFYVSNGGYRIIESGTFRTIPVACPADSRFAIAHVGEAVYYYVNGVRVYTSTVPAPQTFMLVDASLYASGDAIEDASINEVYDIEHTFTGSGTLAASPSITRPMSVTFSGSGKLAGGVQVGNNVYMGVTMEGSGELDGSLAVAAENTGTFAGTSALVVDAPRVHNDGSNSAFEPLETFASNYESTRSHTAFEPLETEGVSGGLQPRVASAYTEFTPLDGTSYVLTGGLIDSQASFSAMDSLSADHEYGESSAGFFGLYARGGEYILVDGILVGDVPAITLDALVQEQPVQGVTADVPEILLSAQSGAIMRGTYATPTLVASGTVPNIGRVTANAPAITLTSTGLVSGVAGVNTTFSFGTTLDARGGHRLVARAPKVTGLASISLGNVGRVTVSAPRVTATIEVSSDPYGRVYGSVPKVTSIYGILRGNVPEVYATAGVFAPVTNDTSYAINVSQGALTVYPDYAFDYIVRFQGKHYGFINNTMYLMEGDTDDGRKIASEIELHPTTAGEEQTKQMPYVYVAGRADMTMITVSKADEQVVGQSFQPAMDYTGAHTRRIKQPRGVKAHHWAVRINNVDGDDLDIHSIEMYVDVSSRRL